LIVEAIFIQLRELSNCMLIMQITGLLIVLSGAALAEAVSPVQKVVELLEDCKGKVAKDLAAEAAVMEEYTTFCDDELKSKGYAIETATREIGDLEATIADSAATIVAMSDEVATLGTVGAQKDKELYDATEVRKAANADFTAAEAELVKSVDECSRAVMALEKGMALLQGGQRKEAKKQLKAVAMALTSIVGAVSIETESSRRLKSFLQSTNAAETDDDLSLHQPQAKMVAYESKSGGIFQTVKDMQAKAEGELSDLRKKEMSDAHEFKMLDSNLNNEISHNQEKISTATKTKASAEESKATAEGDLAETTKTKAADTDYSANLKTECETAASEWAERQASAKEEMAAIDKAKEILVSGVVAFVQSGAKVSSKSDDDTETDEASETRVKLVQKIQSLGKQFHSFGLMQLASVAGSDPFVKIRGLIEDMIAKLLKEAQEEATQKAFCDEEMGKSKKSQDEKTATLDKLQTRIDGASATIAELTEAVKTLEAEIADIDAAQAEATKIRTEENVKNTAAISDFSQSAEAVVKAMGVLKSFYEGAALIQTNSKSGRPSFGGAKTDTGSSIISVLEVAESDFTRLLAETETSEDAAADAYAKQTKENGLSKTTKQTDAKAKASEIKSLTVQLGHSKEDHASTSAELDAVLSYIDKLKPQCEEKAMSYAEKKAAREAEISGLKEALEILEGSALLQTSKNFMPIRRV
jgi:septal ring factor EnvC (AmiA/AmiB activator)